MLWLHQTVYLGELFLRLFNLNLLGVGTMHQYKLTSLFDKKNIPGELMMKKNLQQEHVTWLHLSIGGRRLLLTSRYVSYNTRSLHVKP